MHCSFAVRASILPVALLVLVGCGRDVSARTEAKSQSLSPPPPVTVEVETALPRALDRRIAIVGTLYAAEEAVISTRTAGILRRTYLDVGDTAAPDAPLAEVDTLDYEVAVRQAEAALAEVLARLGVNTVPDDSFDLDTVSTVARSHAQLENARFNYERLANLSGGRMSTVADQELNDASTRLRVAEAERRLAHDEAAALVASARERQSLLQMARQRLSNTLTRTPPIPTTLGREGAVDWVVAERLVTEGQYLNMADQLYRLIVADPLKLRSRVPERYAHEVRTGQPVILEVLGGPASLRGAITTISPAVDPASRTFEVEALIDNTSNAVKPGAFAKGQIVVTGAAPRLSAPVGALVTTGGSTRLYVVEDGTARQRTVQIGRESEGRVEIVSGVREGETIVTQGAAALTDGTIVRIATGSS